MRGSEAYLATSSWRSQSTASSEDASSAGAQQICKNLQRQGEELAPQSDRRSEAKGGTQARSGRAVPHRDADQIAAIDQVDQQISGNFHFGRASPDPIATPPPGRVVRQAVMWPLRHPNYGTRQERVNRVSGQFSRRRPLVEGLGPVEFQYLLNHSGFLKLEVGIGKEFRPPGNDRRAERLVSRPGVCLRHTWRERLNLSWMFIGSLPA